MKHISLKLPSCQTRVQFELLDEQPAQNLDCGVLAFDIVWQKLTLKLKL
jgi:hypothetical protein